MSREPYLVPRARSHLGDIAVSLGVQDWSFNGHVCSGKVTLLCPFNVKGLCFLTYHVGLSRMTYEKILEGLYRHTQHTPPAFQALSAWATRDGRHSSGARHQLC